MSHPELQALHEPIVTHVMGDLERQLAPPASAGAVPLPVLEGIRTYVEGHVRDMLAGFAKNMPRWIPPEILESIERDVAAIVGEAAQAFVRALLGARSQVAAARPPGS